MRKLFILTTFLIISLSTTACSNLAWVDTEQTAIEKAILEINGYVPSDGLVVQQIHIKSHLFVVVTPVINSLSANGSPYFLVGEIVQNARNDKYSWYQTEEAYIAISRGGSIPIKTHSGEDFRLVMNLDIEAARKQRNQILAKQEDVVSEIHEFKGTYFFLKSEANIY